MVKKMIFLALMLIGTFAYGGSPKATDIKDGNERDMLSRVFTTGEISNQTPRINKVDDIERELKRLLEDWKRLERSVKKTIQKELVPYIKRELEKLRKWLRELHPEDDKQGPQKIRITGNFQKQARGLSFRETKGVIRSSVPD